MPKSIRGSGPAFIQNGNDSSNEPWVAFFAQIKKLALKLDELEQAETQKAEERQF